MDRVEIVSPGIATGRLFISKKTVSFSKNDFIGIDEEKNRFKKAINKCKAEIEQLKNKTIKKLSRKEADIFQSHLFFLQDPMLIDDTLDLIEQRKIKAEEALQNKLNELEILFSEIPDPLFKNRWTDLKDVGERLLRLLFKDEKSISHNEKIILLSSEVTPSEILELSDNLSGIITEHGSENSHSAILARALKIPMMIKNKALSIFKNDEEIILDCKEGLIIERPDEEKRKYYQNKIIESISKILIKPEPEETWTADGVRITLLANIMNRGEIEDVIKSKAEGVGIYRTEFAYLNHLPQEEELYKDYKEILEKLSPLPVIFRTLDLGADKWPKYLLPLQESNPSLGLRGIRFSLQNEEIFTSQIRAILRASVYGKGKIIFPMVTCLEDIIKGKNIIKGICEELNVELPPLGIMLEVPSSVLCAEGLAKEVDFMSIGTNDLIQYTMAADREREDTKKWYQSIHPAMLKLYTIASEAGEKHNISVSVCGEIGGDPSIVPILIGCNIKQFSMVPSRIPFIKEKISKLNYKRLKELVPKAINCHNTEEVQEIFRHKT
ncbi:MAG TPA: phosphoenolpyruvate--protein phosphotransferase [Candidatus Eremiobacteraeota bacterium]|nr:MAG: Phosphoenolpyruvate-protein phosphotransferase [bacterium ADurb.Bin363]HPZ07865.1 phosphoenolpyruvate--protein phosphotransferase [Candidatus Eremiobacteraeota bacterium]